MTKETFDLSRLDADKRLEAREPEASQEWYAPCEVGTIRGQKHPEHLEISVHSAQGVPFFLSVLLKHSLALPAPQESFRTSFIPHLESKLVAKLERSQLIHKLRVLCCDGKRTAVVSPRNYHTVKGAIPQRRLESCHPAS